MIVLDTNIVFEAMKPEPNAAVRAWLNDQAAETLYLSSVTLADLLGLFKDRVLPFDSDAARHYADLAVKARNGGRGFPTPDGYIAAVAAARGFIAESRDTSPYEAAGVALINPWKDA